MLRDKGVPHVDSLEKNAVAFFKMSRSIRNHAFSERSRVSFEWGSLTGAIERRERLARMSKAHPMVEVLDRHIQLAGRFGARQLFGQGHGLKFEIIGETTAYKVIHGSLRAAIQLLLLGLCFEGQVHHGDCYDIACAESFFSTLENELIRDEAFVTRDAAGLAIVGYIERFYNPKRLHQIFGYRTPGVVDDEAMSAESTCPKKPGQLGRI